MTTTEMKMCVCAITEILKELVLVLLLSFRVLSLVCAAVSKAFHKRLQGLRARRVVTRPLKY